MADERSSNSAAHGALAPDIPRTGKPLIDTVSQVFVFLGRFFVPRLGTVQQDPAEMSDAELRHACCELAGRLVNALGPIVQASYAEAGLVDDLT